MSGKKEYRLRNEQWLARKAKEEGVARLADGVYYRVLTSGDPMGKQPNPSSIIIAHYTGWTIDGRQFDSSRGGDPLAIRLRQLIEGWIVALQEMHPGDRWELYLSAEKGYGKLAQPNIPANSTLIFDIELIRVG